MKKLISALIMMFLCSMSYAESMKFITVLSSPVGTFNKLEAVDSTASAYGKKVNFCTSIGTQGVVELKGTKTAELTTVVLSKNTTLGKTDEGKFSLNNITLKQGGNITGGRLFGNTVTVNNAASGKADNLYGNTLTVAGAKTKTLNVNSGASKITAQHDGADMVWSNEYQSDTACGNTASCAKQYLLKSKGTASHIECTSTSLSGCAAATNQVGQGLKCGATFYPFCEKGVGTGGSFEGKCINITSCGVNGSMSKTWVGESCGCPVDCTSCSNSECANKGSTIMDNPNCGNFGVMNTLALREYIQNNDFASFCGRICDNNTLTSAGWCNIPGKADPKNVCQFGDNKFFGFPAEYAITCTATCNVTLVECKSVAD